MNLLFLAPRFPYPATRGDTLRSWPELEFLAQRHNVWLACVDIETPVPEHLEKVQSICRDVAVVTRSHSRCLLSGLRSLLAGKSINEGYFGDPRLADILAKWSSAVDFDAIFSFSATVANYAERIDAKRRVLDMVDVDSIKYEHYATTRSWPMRWVYAIEGKRFAQAESRLTLSHDISLLVNQREEAKLQARLPGVHTAVLHNSCELRSTCADSRREDLPTKPIIGFTGSMFYPPNVDAVHWFADHVWPDVRRQFPNAEFWIVGNRPAASVQSLNELPGITVTGRVPEVESYLNQMRVFVAPVQGGLGVQSKLLTAMSAGVPAVVSPDAAGGIDYEGKAPFLVADTADQFADAVLDVLKSDEEAHSLSIRARRVIRDQYASDTLLTQLESWLSGKKGTLPADNADSHKGVTIEQASSPKERVFS